MNKPRLDGYIFFEKPSLYYQTNPEKTAPENNTKFASSKQPVPMPKKQKVGPQNGRKQQNRPTTIAKRKQKQQSKPVTWELATPNYKQQHEYRHRRARTEAIPPRRYHLVEFCSETNGFNSHKSHTSFFLHTQFAIHS